MGILINTVVLIMDDYPRPPEYSQAMSMMNFLLALVFLVEMLLKWVAMGLSYFEDPFNNFDCAIVWISIITMICAWSEAGFGGGAISAFRCFLVLLSLMVFIFGLLGMMFFANQLRFDGNTDAKIAFSVFDYVTKDDRTRLYLRPRRA